MRLPVGQFSEKGEDLARFAFTVQHDLTKKSVADLLKLSTCTAKYRPPYLLERFIEASLNFDGRSADCCINGFIAFTFKRAQQTACDACGAQRNEADGKPAKKMTYC